MTQLFTASTETKEEKKFREMKEVVEKRVVRIVKEKSEESVAENVEEKPTESVEEKPAENVEKTEEKTEEYQWTIRDDVKIVGIIIFMYAILAGLFYIAVTLYRQTDNSSVCSQQTRQISP